MGEKMRAKSAWINPYTQIIRLFSWPIVFIVTAGVLDSSRGWWMRRPTSATQEGCITWARLL